MPIINLQHVSQTLFVPLLARALYTQTQPQPLPFEDPSAMRCLERLGVEVSDLVTKIKTHDIMYFISRAWHIDQAIQRFIQQYPDGSMLVLGVGLDDIVRRHPAVTQWYLVDYPAVMQLRAEVMPTAMHVESIPGNLTEMSWLSGDIAENKPLFIVAPGVLPYLASSELTQLLTALKQQFPRAYCMADFISEKCAHRCNQQLSKIGMVDAKTYGSIQMIEQFIEHEGTLMNAITIYKGIKHAYLYQPLTFLKMCRIDWWRHIMLFHWQFD